MGKYRLLRYKKSLLIPQQAIICLVFSVYLKVTFP